MQLRRYNQTRYLLQIFFSCTLRHNELKTLNNRKTSVAIYKSREIKVQVMQLNPKCPFINEMKHTEIFMYINFLIIKILTYIF